MMANQDDPRLTAYALGELGGTGDAADRAEVEAILADSPEARRFVDDLRAVTTGLRGEFDGETGTELDATRRDIILKAAQETTAPSLRLRADPPAARRSDVYHVITHPAREARRYRTNLLAIAAAVAIVAGTLGLLVSSIFKQHAPDGEHIARNPTPDSPLVSPTTTAQNGSRESLPEVPDALPGAGHDVIALLPGPGEDHQPLTIGPPFTVSPFPPPATNSARGGVAGGYALTFENPFKDVSRAPQSSFAFHVGTASYGEVRRALELNKLPVKEAVRIEELVNFFPYDYTAPTDGQTFAAHLEIAACPWQSEHRLIRIGLKAKEAAVNAAPIASGLHIDVEFNPAQVSAYRLIGYDRHIVTQPSVGENTVSDVMSGQSVTALYEVIPADGKLTNGEALRYQKPPELTTAAKSKELCTVKLHYAAEGAARSQEFAAIDGSSVSPSDDFRFTAAVAGFGMLLRESSHRGNMSYDAVIALAESGKGADLLGERGKFIDLIQRAKGIVR